MKQTSVFAAIVLSTFVLGCANLSGRTLSDDEVAKLIAPEKLERTRNVFLRLLAAAEVTDDVRLRFISSYLIRGSADGGCIEDKTTLKRKRMSLFLSIAVIRKDRDASLPMTAALIAHEIGHIMRDRTITCRSLVRLPEEEFAADKIGVELLKKIGFDGQSAIKQMLFAICEQVGAKCVEDLEMHPSIYRRIKALK